MKTIKILLMTTSLIFATSCAHYSNKPCCKKMQENKQACCSDKQKCEDGSCDLNKSACHDGKCELKQKDCCKA